MIKKLMTFAAIFIAGVCVAISNDMLTQFLFGTAATFIAGCHIFGGDL